MRGDFLLLTQTTTRKKTPWSFQWRKKPRGASRRKKTIGESGGSETLAPTHRSDVREPHRSSQGDSAETIRTEPNAADWTPVVQTVGERFNSNFCFFFVLPVLLLERGGCTLLTAPWLYILTGLSHTHMFRSDRILEILEISGWKPEIVNFAGIFQDKKHP